MKRALRNTKTNFHNDEECKWNCDQNRRIFKQDLLPCKFSLEEQTLKPSDLIDLKEDPQTIESPGPLPRSNGNHGNDRGMEMDDQYENSPWWKKHPNYCGCISFSLYIMACMLISVIVTSQFNFWDCPFGYNLDENNTCSEGMVLCFS